MAIKDNTEDEPQQGGLLEARFPFVHASGSALCTDKFKFPTLAAPSALPTVRVASQRGEESVLKIGKCDCQTPNLDR